MNQPFNNEKYKNLQKQAILKRISQFGKLYIEIGGKLFDDNHASRVLPGFDPNVKMQILSELKDQLEIIFCINANHIVSKKERGDNGLTYAQEVLRLTQLMKQQGLSVLGIVITFYKKHNLVSEFENECKNLDINIFKSYYIENYPNDLNQILSEDGFGKNDYVKTTKNLILVSAPGPSSGKLETCLSQLYLDKQHSISSCYAKYETFPVWNLALDHLANIAYEMATVDLGDKNMVDPYFKKAYNKTAINYNRDIFAFPILSKILNMINEKEVYASPTDMGINSVGFAIENDSEVQLAAFKEIERRHNKHKLAFENNKLSEDALKLSDNLYEKSKFLVEKIKNAK